MREDRYYIQRLTPQVFLIRECLSPDREPGPNDPIVRSFEIRQDAYMQVNVLNEQQRKLDAQTPDISKGL